MASEIAVDELRSGCLCCAAGLPALWHVDTLGPMRSAAAHDRDAPQGTSLFPRDLTGTELEAAPVLASLEDLEIEDLTEDEYAQFIAALS